jgi:hypothetical protein
LPAEVWIASPEQRDQEAVMDTGIVAQPAAVGLVPAELGRQAVIAAQGAAPTGLPLGKAVNPLPQVTPAHNDPSPGNPTAADISTSFVVDLQTRDVVYRVMDLRTRQVLLQVPDAALLRRIAYDRAQAANAATNAPIKHQTDITG